MATEVVKGIASAVRYTIDVRGDRDGVSTRHHTIFKVGDMTVMFTSGSSAHHRRRRSDLGRRGTARKDARRTGLHQPHGPDPR
jgi:hypothetical protein